MSNEIISFQTVDVNTLNPQENGFSLTDLKQAVYRRWKPALTIGITAFTGIFLFTALKTPEYRSESLILLESPQNQEATSIAPTQAVASQYYSAKDLSTEIFVLRSNSIAMNLRYLVGSNGQIKTLAVTSSTSAEEKSTISHNLAIA